jgi:hypothetical protein
VFRVVGANDAVTVESEVLHALVEVAHHSGLRGELVDALQRRGCQVVDPFRSLSGCGEIKAQIVGSNDKAAPAGADHRRRSQLAHFVGVHSGVYKAAEPGGARLAYHGFMPRQRVPGLKHLNGDDACPQMAAVGL